MANSETGQKQTISATALFLCIGVQPRTDWLGGVVEQDDDDPFLFETSLPGIFVAGDVRHASVKRVASAVGQGAVTVQVSHQYLRTV